MNVIDGFLHSEIMFQDLYDEIMLFINSAYIKSGEFEGNIYVIKKMNWKNFIIYLEYIDRDDNRSIPGAVAMNKKDLIKTINDHALTRAINTSQWEVDV